MSQKMKFTQLDVLVWGVQTQRMPLVIFMLSMLPLEDFTQAIDRVWPFLSTGQTLNLRLTFGSDPQRSEAVESVSRQELQQMESNVLIDELHVLVWSAEQGRIEIWYFMLQNLSFETFERNRHNFYRMMVRQTDADFGVYFFKQRKDLFVNHLSEFITFLVNVDSPLLGKLLDYSEVPGGKCLLSREELSTLDLSTEPFVEKEYTPHWLSRLRECGTPISAFTGKSGGSGGIGTGGSEESQLLKFLDWEPTLGARALRAVIKDNEALRWEFLHLVKTRSNWNKVLFTDEVLDPMEQVSV